MATGQRTINGVTTGVPASSLPINVYLSDIGIDWSTVPANTANAVSIIPGDDVAVPPRVKYLPCALVLAKITASGLYGPFDPGATDGRANLAQGSCAFLNFSMLESDLNSGRCPTAFDTGTVYAARLKFLVDGAFAALTDVTLTGVLTAFPGVHTI